MRKSEGFTRSKLHDIFLRYLLPAVDLLQHSRFLPVSVDPLLVVVGREETDQTPGDYRADV